MPVIPNLMERTYMLRLNRAPGPMLDLFAGMSLETAMLALDIGVFEILDNEPATPGEIADRLSVDETGLETMLSFLEHAGYVTERSGTYSLTTMTERWVLESADTSYARYFRFWQDVLYPFWREQAADTIRNGNPPVSVYDWLDEHPDRWPIAQSAFELTAELLGDEIAAELDVPTAGSVLDVGGGHALYSIAICTRYPTVSAVVFDDKAIEDVATGNITAAGLNDRIDFQRGDYEVDIFESGYDVVLVFNIVHGNDRETNRMLFEKLSNAVAPGGQLAILDQFADPGRTYIEKTGNAFLDLTYRVSLGGRTYHSEPVTDWLADAGFQQTGRLEFRDRNMTLLLAELE